MKLRKIRRSGRRVVSLQKIATTFETNFSTQRRVHNVRLGLRMGVMYVSDMPQIAHTSPATLTTDDTVILSCVGDVLLL